MQFQFSGDEAILALVSLVRAVNPAMLRQGSDGFSVDFTPLENKKCLSADERLLLKFRLALTQEDTGGGYPLELEPTENSRLAETLERLESLHPWPPDVLRMSEGLRARLTASQ